jgi:Mn2+/Fe2+ NRAMP family transporter
MPDALRLLVGGPHLLYALLFGVCCLATQIFVRYARSVAVLKWSTLSLLAYVAAVLMVDVPWRQVDHAMLAPPVDLNTRYITTMVAICGVRSALLFFWQASQEVEDQRVDPDREPLVHAPEPGVGSPRPSWGRASWRLAIAAALDFAR